MCTSEAHHSRYTPENKLKRRLNLGRPGQRAIAVIQARSDDEG